MKKERELKEQRNARGSKSPTFFNRMFWLCYHAPRSLWAWRVTVDLQWLNDSQVFAMVLVWGFKRTLTLHHIQAVRIKRHWFLEWFLNLVYLLILFSKKLQEKQNCNRYVKIRNLWDPCLENYRFAYLFSKCVSTVSNIRLQNHNSLQKNTDQLHEFMRLWVETTIAWIIALGLETT